MALIPARMGSSRFPGKPLAPILEFPMIEHVYRRTAMCSALDEVHVATCDQEIHDAVAAFGGRSIDTSTQHQRATDRCAEAVEGLDADVIVMVQGDEPMTVPRMIDLAIKPILQDPDVQCVNLAKLIESEEDFLNPNTIKVVMDRQGDAIYFSREPIPTRRMAGFESLPAFKQVCIIPFRREFLLNFVSLKPTPLEEAESIDMLRALEHGYKVRMVETQYRTFAVDTRQDLEFVESLMRDDPLLDQYTTGREAGSGG